MHTIHEDLLGFDARQIWFDGCSECERRGRMVPNSLGTLDTGNLARAWNRMLLWKNDDPSLGRVSDAERPLLRFLDQVRITNQQLIHAGVVVR